MSSLQYAVYPGTVVLYNGVEKAWTAADLAAAYGVQDEPYLVVNKPVQAPQSFDYFNYIHLFPRADDKYQDIKYVAEDDGQTEHWRPDFDGTKKYLQETDPLNIYPDENSELKL